MSGVPANLALADPPELADSIRDEQLARLELFHSLDLSVVRSLLSDFSTLTLAPGEVLLEAGRPNDSLYLVLDGRLSVRLVSTDAAPMTTINAGEAAGELSVLDGQPASAYVVAEVPSRVLAIDKQILWMLVNTSHAVSSNLLLTLAKRMRISNQLISDKSGRLEQYRFHATVDALTGLFNRFCLYAMLPRQMHRSRRGAEPLSLLMVDVDHFKQHNDAHGHVAGDCALGGAAENPNEGTVETFISSADEALYRAKRAGRDRVCV